MDFNFRQEKNNFKLPLWVSMENMKINVRNNDVDKAMRILKKKLLVEGDLKKVRESDHFVSKGEKRKIAKAAGVKRWKKKRLLIEKKQKIEESRVHKKKSKTRPITKVYNKAG